MTNYGIYWLIAAVALLASLIFYQNWSTGNSSDQPLVETDCGTLLGQRDSIHGVHVFKVRMNLHVDENMKEARLVARLTSLLVPFENLNLDKLAR